MAEINGHLYKCVCKNMKKKQRTLKVDIALVPRLLINKMLCIRDGTLDLKEY